MGQREVLGCRRQSIGGIAKGQDLGPDGASLAESRECCDTSHRDHLSGSGDVSAVDGYVNRDG